MSVVSVYFRCVDYASVSEFEEPWYTFVLNDDGEEDYNNGRSCLNPFSYGHMGEYNVIVGLKSVIYCLGEGYDGHRRVYRLDTTAKDSHLWDQELNFIVPRVHPQVVAVNGKIYVMGGRCRSYDINEPTYFAEVFDPTQTSWMPVVGLSRHKEGFPRLFFAAALAGGNNREILLSTAGQGTYLYDVVDDKPGEYLNPIIYKYPKVHSTTISQPIAVERTLYWYSPQHFDSLIICDVDTGEHCIKPIEGFIEALQDCHITRHVFLRQDGLSSPLCGGGNSNSSNHHHQLVLLLLGILKGVEEFAPLFCLTIEVPVPQKGGGNATELAEYKNPFIKSTKSFRLPPSVDLLGGLLLDGKLGGSQKRKRSKQCSNMDFGTENFKKLEETHKAGREAD